MDTNRRQPQMPTGFAGLTSLVSDVDGLINAINRSSPDPNASRPAPMVFAAGQPTASTKSGRWVLWALGAVVGLFLLAMAVGGPSTEPQTRPSRSSDQPGPVSFPESLPPVGTNHVLTAAQIRYCLSEDIRLEAARDFTDSSTATDRFNAMVGDYNNRCASFRYRERDLESIRRELEGRRASLEAEGLARFR